MSKVSIVRCENYDPKTLFEKIQQSISQLDRTENLIGHGEKILIKPNLLGAHTPEQAVTTHPEFVRAVIRLAKAAGAVPSIGDSPSVSNVSEVFDKTGLKKIAAEEEVELINLGNSPAKEFQIEHPTVKKVYISKIIFEFDGIINLPKLKTHSLTTLTLSIKNLYGIVPGLLKSQYHILAHSTDSFSRLLAEIYKIVQPKILLNIVDGIVGMDGEGPAGGRIKNFGLILSSKDAVALDALLFNFFNINSERVPLINYCKNLGETSIEKIVINNNEDLKDYRIANSVLPKTHIVNYIPQFVAEFAKKFIRFKPRILNSKCKLCMKCYEICPLKAIVKTASGKFNINYKNCTNCFCCYEVCPHHAVEIVESLPMKIARNLLYFLIRRKKVGKERPIHYER
ncbi:MAG: DUF362 domain-containing protein [Elusimicrobiota bacterium]|nr:DUF362 domain-containing protein [Elusimicrobiota bacterium]